MYLLKHLNKFIEIVKNIIYKIIHFLQIKFKKNSTSLYICCPELNNSISKHNFIKHLLNNHLDELNTLTSLNSHSTELVDDTLILNEIYQNNLNESYNDSQISVSFIIIHNEDNPQFENLLSNIINNYDQIDNEEINLFNLESHPKLTVDSKQINSILGKGIKLNENDKLIKESEICSVCLEHFSINDYKRTLKCDHSFHKTCIDYWLKHNNRTCPICRNDSFEEIFKEVIVKL
jgi:hypothetical protein